MKTALASALITALALASIPAQATTTNLLTDGSFESVSITNGSWTTLYTSSAKSGWSSGPAGYEIRNNVAGKAEDGQVFVELDTYSNSSISQTVATTAGATYNLSFWYAPRTGVSYDSNPIEVLWNGEKVVTVSGDGTSTKPSPWSEVKYSLTGTGKDTLTFMAVGTPDSYGGSIDNVKLTAAVPEPETYAMLLAGLGLMGTVARRRKHE